MGAWVHIRHHLTSHPSRADGAEDYAVAFVVVAILLLALSLLVT